MSEAGTDTKQAHCCIATNSSNIKVLSVDEMPTYPSGLHGGEKQMEEDL